MMNGESQSASICLQAMEPEDEAIKVTVATNESYTVEYAADAAELAVLQRYFGEHCNEGKQNRDIKTADILPHRGDAAANATADVTRQ